MQGERQSICGIRRSSEFGAWEMGQLPHGGETSTVTGIQNPERVDARGATSALFNMLRWYVKPEIHLSCDLSSTREQEKLSRGIVHWWRRGFSPTGQAFAFLYPLSVRCSLCTRVNIPVMHKRSRENDTSCCCWFQWGLGCLKAWLWVHLTLFCCVCASQRLLYMFAGTQAIICLHVSVCLCAGRCLGPCPGVSAWGYSTVP